MSTTTDHPAVHLRRTLNEVALVLAGAFHRFDADERLVDAVGCALAETYGDALRGAADAARPRPRLHPAMARLIDMVDGSAAQGAGGGAYRRERRETEEVAP